MNKVQRMTGASLRIEEQPRTLRELALDRLRTAIVEHHFPPGTRLTERELCEQMGVSRSVVREVIRHLEAEGLVESAPHHGPVVATLGAAAAAEIYEIRGLLESSAAHDAAVHASPETIGHLRDALSRIRQGYAAHDHHGVLQATMAFYETMFKAGGKAIAWDVVKRLNSRISWLRAMTIASPGRSVSGFGQMEKIFRAIEQRQPDAAAAASREHVANAAALAQRLLAGAQD
jgi:DNA-binding GntR family transcriptional regulator